MKIQNNTVLGILGMVGITAGAVGASVVENIPWKSKDRETGMKPIYVDTQTSQSIQPREPLEPHEPLEPQESQEFQQPQETPQSPISLQPQSRETEEAQEPQPSRELLQSQEPQETLQLQDSKEPLQSVQLPEPLQPQELHEPQESPNSQTHLQCSQLHEPEEHHDLQQTQQPQESRCSDIDEFYEELLEDLRNFAVMDKHHNPTFVLTNRHAQHIPRYDETQLKTLQILMEGVDNLQAIRINSIDNPETASVLSELFGALRSKVHTDNRFFLHAIALDQRDRLSPSIAQVIVESPISDSANSNLPSVWTLPYCGSLALAGNEISGKLTSEMSIVDWRFLTRTRRFLEYKQTPYDFDLLVGFKQDVRDVIKVEEKFCLSTIEEDDSMHFSVQLASEDFRPLEGYQRYATYEVQDVEGHWIELHRNFA